MRLPLCLSAISVAVASHAATPAFPSDKDTLDPSRWKDNSSGAMSTRFDETEQAVVFSVAFPPKGDRWIYPKFFLRKGETLNGAESVSFELRVMPQDDYQGLKCAYVMLSPNTPTMFAYDAPAPGAWHSITVQLRNAEGTGKEDVAVFQVGMNPRHAKHGYAVRNIRFGGTPLPKRTVAAIRTRAPGTVWLEHETPTFTMTTPLPALAYVLTDWHGTVLHEGLWPDNGGSPLSFSPLQPGYYTLATTHDGKEPLPPFTFAVVVDPKTRPENAHSFFGVDSAQSWLAAPGSFECPYYDGDAYLLVSELIYRAGIPNVRDRLRWGDVNPTPNAYNYGQYLRNAELLKERGILLSGMFHDAPTWADRGEKLPRDLCALFLFCKKTAAAFGDRMGNWEFWNEQDIKFAPDPVWDYAACMKAAYLGFKAGRPETVVAPGAVCRPGRSAYDIGMYANDMAKYCEIMNFHTYSPLSQYPRIFAEMREFMATHGIGERQLWMTECGTNSEGHSDADGVRKGMKRHSPEQEMILAEFLAKSQILLMMEGVARNYTFVFPPYNERDGAKDWGLMRRDGSVKPGYSAFSTITDRLVQAKLLGEIDIREGVRAFVFEQPDGSQTLVFWSVSDLDAAGGRVALTRDDVPLDLQLPVPDGSYTLTDLLGMRRTVQAENGRLSLRSTRYPAYLAGLEGLRPDRKPFPTGRVERHRPARDEDLTVVVRLDLNTDDFEIAGQKSTASLHTSSGRVRLQVWNLDQTPKSGRLEVDGGTFSGLPETIAIPAMGKAEFNVVYTPQSVAAKGAADAWNTDLIITGTFNGKSISRFRMPVFMFGAFIASCRDVPLNASKPEDWRRNDSATTTTITFDQAENAVRFDLVWEDEVDRWFYPEHVLKLPDESFACAAMLAFEVKSCQDKVENDFRHHLLMLCVEDVREHGTTKSISYAPPLNDWETRYIPLGSQGIHLEAVRMIRLGANPRGKKLTFWLRNLRLLKPQE